MIKGLHIEPTNICTLKCAGCSRTQFQIEYPGRWKNHVLDPEAMDRFIDVDITGLPIELAGNYGDPIYHPEFIDIVQRLKRRGALLNIVTNGSYKKQDWWQELAAHLTQQDTVVFSIDGTPENFTQYRENADWESILVGIKAMVVGPAQVVWKYIPFNFNEDTIEQAREISQDLGVDEFRVTPSSRFDNKYTQHLKPKEVFVDWRASKLKDWKHGVDLPVEPRCATGKWHHISAEGRYTPCCFVANHVFYYKTIFGRERGTYAIANTTLSQILGLSQTQDFFNNITIDPPSVCRHSCPKRD